MKAMILAAGVGSRLGHITADTPKPMVPVRGRPVMEHIVNLLRLYEIKDVVANLHYLPEMIMNYFGDGSGHGIRLAYSVEEKLLGTAGGVKTNQWFLDETFLVISGDALTDINLAAFLKFHREKKAVATIALKEVADVEQFGVVITDETGRIRNFQEKPKKEEALSNLVNTGIYIFEPEIFEMIPRGEFYDFGRNLFPLLVERGEPFYGYPMDGYWCDIGTVETYQKACQDVSAGLVRLYDGDDGAFKTVG
ncbi:nucleotidyltransferase family protein [bacterium]|nr:MAG: nucleotidyltransferase family protein [bacterium]